MHSEFEEMTCRLYKNRNRVDREILILKTTGHDILTFIVKEL